MDNGELAGQIDDQQGAFNLNNLVSNGKVEPVASRAVPAPAADPGPARGPRRSLVDWLDADSEPQPQDGAEDSYYQAQQPPYLAANRPLIDVAELALVRGFDDAVRARLRPFVTALPRFTAVNVNTAPPEVLAAVVRESGSRRRARAGRAARARLFPQPSPTSSRSCPPGAVAGGNDVATSSEFFLASVRVTHRRRAGARQRAARARERAGWPAVVWRKYP